MDNYELLNVIYQSKNCILYQVRCKSNNQTYALKKYLNNQSAGNLIHKDLQKAISAIKVQKTIKSPFVLNILDFFESDDGKLITVTEYCDQEDLKTFSQHHPKYNIQERIIWSIILQLGYVLLELNELKLHLRNLIPENILLTLRNNNYHLKLIDFTKCSKQILCQQPVPYMLLPPETLFQGQYTQKSHVWQLGHCIYYLITKHYLFTQFDRLDTIKDTFNKKNISISIDPQYSDDLKSFVSQCLEIDQAKRPDIIDLMKCKEIQQAIKRKCHKFNVDQLKNILRMIQIKDRPQSPIKYKENEIDIEKTHQNNYFTPVKGKQTKLMKLSKSTNSEQPKPLKSIQIQHNTLTYRKQCTYFTPPNKKNNFAFLHQSIQDRYQSSSYQKLILSKSSQSFTSINSLTKRTVHDNMEIKQAYHNLLNSKKDLCLNYLGIRDYHIVKNHLTNSASQQKIQNYIETKYSSKLDIMSQIKDVVQIEKLMKQQK